MRTTEVKTACILLNTDDNVFISDMNEELVEFTFYRDTTVEGECVKLTMLREMFEEMRREFNEHDCNDI